MAAQLLGTTGNWGIPNDQPGILITDLSFDFSSQEKPVLDKGGEIIGLSLYQEKVEIKLSRLVAKTSSFNGKIGAALALANAIPAHLQRWSEAMQARSSAPPQPATRLDESLTWSGSTGNMAGFWPLSLNARTTCQKALENRDCK